MSSPQTTIAHRLNYTDAMRPLCVDMTRRLAELTHIDMERVAIRFCQARQGGRHGVQASLTPMRFADGSLETTRRGRRWTIQRLYAPDGREMLYILSFYLPRFQNQTMREKLATIIHELWHIGPLFDGDLRRHEGRCYAHGSSEARYHAAMQALADRWLELGPPSSLFAFLEGDYQFLKNRYPVIVGTRIPSPRLIPVTTA